ncbi:hypothetical protein BOTBODRAFT_178229 [Botryobasidium botryosum FD-172 SS1]|uniref:Uncharacterized protein n=1 Tax=Botryobasidium botryosum (strain FD-172 SS1) TaxID=930990 RepID=A0A067MEW7_BOTB1|nr:hypothetical protein BOTBODRAFT_178229 [Botryobasidium botryosum FD-172 SS1]
MPLSALRFHLPSITQFPLPSCAPPLARFSSSSHRLASRPHSSPDSRPTALAPPSQRGSRPQTLNLLVRVYLPLAFKLISSLLPAPNSSPFPRYCRISGFHYSAWDLATRYSYVLD